MAMLLFNFIIVLVSAAAVEFGVGAIYKQSAGAAAAEQNLLCVLHTM